MKQLTLLLGGFLIVACAFCQPTARLATPAGKAALDSERLYNFYANRKYTFGFGESLYGNLGAYHPFGVFEISFSDRLTWLDLFKNASLETTAGIGFEPYQGTRVYVGGDYELLSKRLNFNLYMGLHYALGLAQATTMADNSNVYVGYHHYLIPFVGCMFWPHKKDILDEVQGSADADLNRNPGFWQLFYFKLQVGCNFLVSPLQVDTSNSFNPQLYGFIKKNALTTLFFKFGIGINIPTEGRKRREYDRYRQKVKDEDLF